MLREEWQYFPDTRVPGVSFDATSIAGPWTSPTQHWRPMSGVGGANGGDRATAAVGAASRPGTERTSAFTERSRTLPGVRAVWVYGRLSPWP